MTCNREAPSVEEAAQRWAGQAEFVGVAWTGSDDQFTDFIDEHSLTFPQISDDSGDIYARFGIPVQPGFAVILPDGEVQTLIGAADGEILDSLIDQALA